MTSLKEKAFIGVKFTSLSKLIMALTQFVQIVILARILNPQDFGLVGMVLVVTGFAQIFSDAGISKAIIYYQEISKKNLSTLYWISVLTGFFIFILLWMSIPLIVNFFNEPQIRGLLKTASFLFLIIPLGQQFLIILQKDVMFDKIAKIDIFSTFFGFGITIVAALQGEGAVSIVYGHLMTAIMKSIFLFFTIDKKYKPILYFNINEVKEYIKFGLFQLGERTIHYFNAKIDQILIGKMLGAEALGYYNIAFNLTIQVMMRVNSIINDVAFPLYAKIQNQLVRLRNAYIETLKIVGLLNLPFLLTLAIFAKPLIAILYGENWIQSSPLLVLLALAAIFRAINNPIGSLQLALGRADLGFKWNLMKFIISPLLIFASTFWGIKAIAAMVLFLQVLYFFASYPIMIKVLIGTCFKQLFSKVIVRLGIYCAIISIYLSVLKYLFSLELPNLVFIILSGGVVYLFLVYNYEKQIFLDFKKYLFK